MKKNALNIFIIQNLVLSVIVLALGYFILNYLIADYNLEVFPYLVGLFFFVTSFSHFFALKSLSKKGSASVNTAMGLTTFKLLVYLVFVLIYILNTDTDKMLFVLTFFSLYVIYSVFDIYKIMSQIKKQK